MRTSMRACAGAATAVAIIVGPIALASAASAAPYTKDPSTKLNAGHVKSGAPLTVSGSGWGDDQVEISLGGVVLGVVDVGPNGVFEADFTVPTGLACHYTVTTRGLTTGDVSTNRLTVNNCGHGANEAKNENKGNKAGKAVTRLAKNPEAVGGLATASVLPLGAVALLRARRRR